MVTRAFSVLRLAVVTDPLAWLMDFEGVGSAYAGVRDGIDVMLRDRGLRRTSPEMTAESLLRGAYASAVLEGSASSLDEVRATGGDDVAQASVRVSTELLSLLPVVRATPLQAFARLHALAGAGAVGPEELGRPRSAEAAARLQALSRALVASSSVPGLVVAAWAHAEIVTAAPFASHNGIVARALERLLVAARGVDEKSLVVPEAGHLSVRAAYESNLVGYREGGRAGVHSWLLYAAEAYAAGAEASPLVAAS